MTGLPQPPTPPPPLSAEFENSANPGGPGASTQNWKMARGSNGQSAIDYGNKTVITNPNAQQVITLDHVKKEAMVMPLPAAPAGLGGMSPGAPKAPSPQTPPSPTPPVEVTDLGKKLIAGHEAQGKLFTFKLPPPQLPKLPTANLPQMPKPPSANLPQTPQVPAGGTPPPPSPPAPAAPKIPPPQLPHTVEVWTSPKLQLPLLTKSGSGAAQQTTTCKQVTPGEPPSSAFQIPAGYKVVHPPTIPHLPSIAKPSIPPLPRS